MKTRNLYQMAALMALFLFSGVSHALMITIYDGTTTVTVTDGGVGDLSGVAGKVLADGVVGNWEYSVTAQSNSSNLFADLFETSLDTSTNTAGGVLTITVSDVYTGLSNVGNTGLATASFNPSTLGGSLFFESKVDSTIVHLDTLVSITTSGGGTGITITDPMTVSQRAVITHSGAKTTSFDASTHVNVPEPISLALMGIGLIGLGLARRRQ